MPKPQVSIDGYRSASEPDVAYVTVTTVEGETLYAAVRVTVKRRRVRADVSHFETPDGEYVDDASLTKHVQKWLTSRWNSLPTR